MLVPDGWEATSSDGTYELTQKGENGALHLSTSRRRVEEPLSAQEAEDAVLRFLDQIDPIERTEVRVLSESPEQHRAVARCTSIDPASSEMCSWLVFLVLWSDWVLMCTCTTPFGSRMPDEAERMFATIHPHQA